MTVPMASAAAIGHYASGKFALRPTYIVLAFRDLTDPQIQRLNGLLMASLEPLSSPSRPGPIAAHAFHRTFISPPATVSREASLYVWNSVPHAMHMSSVTTHPIWGETSQWGAPSSGTHHAILRLSERLVFLPAEMPKVIDLLEQFARIRSAYAGKDPATWGYLGLAQDVYNRVFPSLAHARPNPTPVQPGGSQLEVYTLSPGDLRRAAMMLPSGTNYGNSPPSFVLP